MENSVSKVISDAELRKVNDAVKTITDTLAPYVKALTPAQRHKIPKMGDSRLPFVTKAVHYAESNPEMFPGYLKAQMLAANFTTVQVFLEILRPLQQVNSNLSDTILKCGSQAYIMSLSFYAQVKRASKLKRPGANAIAADMGSRFSRPPRKSRGVPSKKA